jgi:hypothetical protein
LVLQDPVSPDPSIKVKIEEELAWIIGFHESIHRGRPEMPGPTSNGRGRRCPVCGRGVLRPRLISEAFEYGDEGDTVVVRTQDVPAEDRHACGESFGGPKAARIRHEAIGRACGLPPPRDIKASRERLDLSPGDFARLIGIGTDLLSQWEDGSVWQDRTADPKPTRGALYPGGRGRIEGGSMGASTAMMNGRSG